MSMFTRWNRLQHPALALEGPGYVFPLVRHARAPGETGFADLRAFFADRFCSDQSETASGITIMPDDRSHLPLWRIHQFPAIAEIGSTIVLLFQHSKS